MMTWRAQRRLVCTITDYYNMLRGLLSSQKSTSVGKVDSQAEQSSFTYCYQLEGVQHFARE